MNKALSKNLIVLLLITAILFFIITVYSDLNSLLKSFNDFNWSLLPILLILSLGNYFIRFLKWDYYLRQLKILIPQKQSVKIFFSGLSMSASPAKMGELIKSILLKEIYQEPISKTATIVFAERFTDFLSLTFLTLVGFYFYDYSASWVFFVLIFFVTIIIIISNRSLVTIFFKNIAKLSFADSILSKIKNLYEGAYLLLKPKPLFTMLVLSIFSWFFECLAFYLILTNYDQTISLMFATFVYSLSTIAGAVSMLPGGLGVTEGSLSLLLISKGLLKENAITSTLVIRIVTLWFAVLLGSITLLLFRRKNKINN